MSEVSPIDIDAATPIIDGWCTVAADCLTGVTSVPSDITCVSNSCVCTNSYSLFEGTVCRLNGDTATPVTTIYVELTWDSLRCAELPPDYETQFKIVLSSIYNVPQTDIEIILKCGSVVISSSIKNVAVTTAKNTNIETAFAAAQANNEVLNTLGVPNTVDTFTGTGMCSVVYPVSVAQSIGGVCQPVECVSGFIAIRTSSINDIDSCAPILVTSSSTSSDDSISGAAIAGIVFATFFVVVLVGFVIYCCCFKKKSIAEEDQRSQYQEEDSAFTDIVV